MKMKPGLRNFALTAHVTVSVGWLSAVAAFLALAIVGLSSQDTWRVRTAYVAMDPITWYVIVPLAFTSLMTGLVQSLGTTWGLFRHYWVLAKLVLTVLATGFLLVHTQPIDYMAGLAADAAFSSGDSRRMRIQLVVDAGAALLVLLATTTLAVYKPRGVTRYGWRKQHENRVQ